MEEFFEDIIKVFLKILMKIFNLKTVIIGLLCIIIGVAGYYLLFVQPIKTTQAQVNQIAQEIIENKGFKQGCLTTLDYWKNPVCISYSEKKFGNRLDVISNGPDGERGSSDDITATDIDLHWARIAGNIARELLPEFLKGFNAAPPN